MIQTALALALAAHGAGHAVGFWMGVPGWFAAAWLVPGAGFLIGAWGFSQHASWWSLVLVGSAAASLALAGLAKVGLQAGPYASASVFNAVVIGAVLLTSGRRLLPA